MKKIIAAVLLAGAAVTGLSACSSDADQASRNLSNSADNFEINRRIIFYNGITDQYMLTIEGKCSIVPDTGAKKLDVTCKGADGNLKKHFLGLSDNVTYLVEQIDGAAVSTDRPQVNFKPQSLIPDVRAR
ncbi:hypothetical protein SEA_ELEPHANTOON_68 [Mycobacterium phage Elephantoon]|nr:hypothetical protein SEA_ELEPHANTOON_68 [Mycobacterium phage Elephantoon]